jgi:hypothetical protein
MPIFVRFLASAVLVLASTATNAELSSASHPIFGLASLTKDSAQGLFWLTPEATVGLSFLEVTDLLATDSRFAGFRVATLSELETLYADAGIPDINVPGFGALYGTPENVPGVEYLQGLTGVTYSVQVAGQSLAETAGFVGSTFASQVNGFLSVEIGNTVLRGNVPTVSGPMSFASAYSTWGSLPVGTKTEGVGTWLVSSVPEPSAWLTLSLGILVLAAARSSAND